MLPLTAKSMGWMGERHSSSACPFRMEMGVLEAETGTEYVCIYIVTFLATIWEYHQKNICFFSLLFSFLWKQIHTQPSLYTKRQRTVLWLPRLQPADDSRFREGWILLKCFPLNSKARSLITLYALAHLEEQHDLEMALFTEWLCRAHLKETASLNVNVWIPLII